MRTKIKISIYRDCRNRPDKDEPCPVKLRVYTSGQAKHFPLIRPNGLTPWMSKKDYDAAMSKRTPSRLKPAREFFDAEILRARQIVERIVKRSGQFSFEQFGQEWTGQVTGSLTADMEAAAARKKKSTQLVYTHAAQRLAAFLGKTSVDYADLTPVVVEKFVFDMEDSGLSADTIKTYCAALKATIKQAQKKKIVPGDYDPFSAYTAPRGVRRQLQLTVNQWRAVLDYSSTDYQKQLARDTFVFGVLCNGQYPATIYRMKREQILGDWITFVREKTKDKTGQPLEAYITPTMWEIIERYESESGPYIFPALTGREDHFNAVSTARHRANKYLKLIAKEINKQTLLKLPSFTMKYVRGTYYRIAQEVGGLTAEQARLQAGHKSVGMMEHYDRGYNREDVAAAARKIG